MIVSFQSQSSQSTSGDSTRSFLSSKSKRAASFATYRHGTSVHVNMLSEKPIPSLFQSNLHRIRTQSLHLLIVDVLLKVQTSELSRNNHFPVGLIHLRFVTLVLYLESLWWSTVQLALLLHEQSDLALLLVELVDQQSAWLDQTPFLRAVFHSVVASLTL
jgi:hypothetical protein